MQLYCDYNQSKELGNTEMSKRKKKPAAPAAPPANPETPEQAVAAIPAETQTESEQPESAVQETAEQPEAVNPPEAETAPAEQAAPSAAAKKQRSPMNPIQIFLLNALIILTVLWLLFGFILGIAAAPNGDMAPNIKASDLLIYYRLDKDMQAGDVVVLRRNDTTYIGRIAARGGDTVDITDSGQLIINGNTVSEPELHSSTPRYEGFVEYPVRLNDGEFFILADHRNGGEDSRYYGAVRTEDLLGTVITVIRRNHL